ncbi:hypothetical protein M9H77_00585 [Catharanthus roseus]|nr:hypothetical protein M9H77_00585 [Catharanthus roseus]
MRALRQFTWRRITVFHRGGGSKRLQRRIDLKRSTSSMGIVERIEYDPNRSSRIALSSLRRVRFENLPRPPSAVDQRKVACFSPGLKAAYVVVGLPTRMPSWSKSPFTSKGAGSKKTCAKDVFFSALSSPNPKAKGETASLSFGSSFAFPRIAVAGAKPAFFAPRMREKVRGKNTFSLCEIRKWRTHSSLWAHRIKRKAALSWQSFSLLAKPIGEGTKDGTCKVDRATVVARGQAVTIERLSLSIPSHTGREVKWQGKAIRPFGSSRSIAHIQTSDWGTGQRP